MPIIVDPTLIPGTGLDLTSVYLNNAADLSDYQAFSYAGDSLNLTATALAEVRQNVNRRRLVATGVVQASGGGTVAVSEALAVTFPYLDLEGARWLRDHVGMALCVRDHVGSKFYAAYMSVPREVETFYRNQAATGIITSVSLTLEQVTFPEVA